MKKYFLIPLCLACLGCSVKYDTVKVPEPQFAPMIRRFVSLSDIRSGLKRSEVKSLLGDRIVVGYEMTDLDAQQYQPITYENPYKMENYQEGAKAYAVDFYLLGIKVDDGQVTDDELVPMVFQNEILAGYGWDYFKAKIKAQKN